MEPTKNLETENDMDKPDLHKKRHEEILANFRGQKGDGLQCSKDIYFANTNGVMFSQQQLNLRLDIERKDQVKSVSNLHANNTMVVMETSLLRVSATTKSWFVQFEKEATLADFDELNDSILSPRSSLKIID